MSKIRIGIDPGTKTGVAVSESSLLHTVTSFSILNAMDFVETEIVMNPSSSFEIIIEDATKRGGSKETAWGAGHVCRDTKLWKEWAEKFKENEKIKFYYPRPSNWLVDKECKKNRKFFSLVTGWEEMTNDHGRDAAMLIYDGDKAEMLRMYSKLPIEERKYKSKRKRRNYRRRAY